MPATGRLMKFPSLSRSEAESIAQDFLSRVLDTPIEAADLEEGVNRLYLYDNGNYYFYGTLILNALGTPVNIRLSVDSASREVASFYRSDSGLDYADLPAVAAVTKDAAAATLFASFDMKLNYVTSGDEAHQAILRYIPDMPADYVVDAITGELVEITPMLYGYGSAEDSAAAESGKGGLTGVEQQAVTDLEGVLAKADLEAAARGIAELGITTGYSLQSINYYKQDSDTEAAQIYAYLSFVMQSGSERANDYAYGYKNVTLEAKTGEFISASAYAYASEDPVVRYTRTQSEVKARAFAQQYNPDELALTSLADEEQNGDTRYQTFTFVRQAGGIDFPENYIYVTVDATDGTIGSYNVTWDDQMRFADPAGIKTADQAKDIYTNAAGIALCYVGISAGAEEDTFIYDPQMNLTLVYDFADQNVWGVDASTGEPLTSQTEQETQIAYDDVAGHYAQTEIEKLAQYGIGYTGGAFAPERALTQKDALILLAAAGGYTYDQSAEDYENSLYSAAYSMGILTKAEKSPEAKVTRSQLVRMIINAAGYGEVARLENIYAVHFGDASDVPASLYGYVAIAKGLGVISGTPSGRFYPNAVATRAHLAVMLCNIMSR